MRTAPHTRTPDFSTPREKVFEMPSALFDVDVVRPNGEIACFNGVRCFTRNVSIDLQGRVTIEIDGKTSSEYRAVCFPMHFFPDGNVLYVVKKNSLQTASGNGRICFGLNYCLFNPMKNRNWDECVILHRNEQGTIVKASTSRKEWDDGELKTFSREVQMFLTIDVGRFSPVDAWRAQVPPHIQEWLEKSKVRL